MRLLKISVSVFCLLMMSACGLESSYNSPLFFDNEVLEQTLELKTPALKTPPFQPKDLKDSILNELIKETLENAPDIKTAKARVENARALRRSLTAGLLPSFDGQMQYSDENLGDNMEINPIESVYQAGLSISWEIDLFGKKQHEVKAASAQEYQMVAALENTVVSLITEVCSAYIALRTTQYLLAQTKEDLKIQESLSKLTHDKYDSGLSSAIDVNQADYQLATTKAVIPKLETEIETYQNTLAVLAGKPAGSFQKRLSCVKENLISKPFAFSLENFYALPVDVIRLRPDVKGMEASLKAQNEEIEVAISNLFPSISFSSFLGFKSMQLPNLFEHESLAHTYQTSVAIPFFHFGALWEQINAQKATMKGLVAQYEKTLLNATQEIRNVLVGLQKMKIRHNELEIAWQKMDKAARLARNRYESGLIDYFQVLDAEERRIAAQSALTTSSGALYQNVLNFYKAIGGHFSFDKIKENKN